MNTDRKTIDVQFLMEMPDLKSPNPKNVVNECASLCCCRCVDTIRKTETLF